MKKKKAVLFSESKYNIDRVWSPESKNELETLFDLKTIYSKEELLKLYGKENLSYIFTTWGMPSFTREEVKTFKSLECVFYAAGSVQGFAREFISEGIHVFSAWAANAVPVAEYAVSQILLANKGFFGSSVLAKKGDREKASEHFNMFRGNYGQKVGLLGAGMIGKLVIQMLSHYNLKILVFDPFLPDDKAAELGVEKVSLNEVFKECVVVSNHLANNPQTVGIINYSQFSLMPDNGVFINTGRGAQVVEEDLCRALREKPGRFAVLDVTWPEPPVKGHEFYSLDNVILTPHIAGSSGDETHRMAEYMLQEYKLYSESQGHKTRYEVTEKMLETMA